MSCTNISLPTIPSIPTFGINVAIPFVPIPSLSLNLCCNFQLTVPFLDEIVSALNAAFAIVLAPLSSTLFVLADVVNTIIATANSVLMSLAAQLNCPLNSISTVVSGA